MMEYNQYINDITSFFVNKGWKTYVCDYCGRTFVSKKWRPDCGCHTSISVENRKCKRKVDLVSIKDRMDSFFINKEYRYSTFPNVKNPENDTMFVVAAIQQYNVKLKKNYCQDTRMIYSPQPCVRLKDTSSFDIESGYLHSFVNSATLKLDASFETYCQYLDDWISFFSDIGIHASRLCIVISDTPVNILNVYKGWNIDFMYNNLELGHCSYLDQVCSTYSGKFTGIDCGFCLERIGWIVNGGSFFDNLIPEQLAKSAIKYNVEFQELMRTIVLIVMSGINVGQRNDAYQLKKLLVKLTKLNDDYRLLDWLIGHYFQYWNNFITNTIPMLECKRIIYTAIKEVALSDEE